MPKKKSEPGYAICGQCAEVIDLKALNLAIAEDRPYVHYCGRVLHWGGENAEVPTQDRDDDDPIYYADIGYLDNGDGSDKPR